MTLQLHILLNLWSYQYRRALTLVVKNGWKYWRKYILFKFAKLKTRSFGNAYFFLNWRKLIVLKKCLMRQSVKYEERNFQLTRVLRYSEICHVMYNLLLESNALRTIEISYRKNLKLSLRITIMYVLGN